MSKPGRTVGFELRCGGNHRVKSSLFSSLPTCPDGLNGRRGVSPPQADPGRAVVVAGGAERDHVGPRGEGAGPAFAGGADQTGHSVTADHHVTVVGLELWGTQNPSGMVDACGCGPRDRHRPPDPIRFPRIKKLPENLRSTLGRMAEGDNAHE